MEKPRAAPVSVDPAREAALAVVEAALERRGGLDEALGAAALAGLDPRDRGFARMTAMTVLRRLGQIDRALGARLQKPPPPPVVALLRLGAAQALYMDVPDFAAVSTTLALAEARGDTRPFKGLINGVLRGLLREPPVFDPETLAPAWLFARWRAAYGGETAQALAAAIADEPATDLTLRDPAEAETVAAQVEGRVLAGGGVRAGLKGDLSGWPGFAEGRWWVQDAAAAVPARLLAVRPGETVLDLCAAPGGKTLQLAAAGGRVTAVDRSAPRLRRLAENLARTGLEAEVVAQPAETWEDPRKFDAVLLDAPCSATGTFRRQPDVLWAARPADIAKLAEVQARLLDAAADRLKPGGRLVYCVCSLEPEEGEAQIEAVLRRRPDLRRDPVAPGEAGAPAASRTPDGDLRILPRHAEGGIDGFFVSRLQIS
ncbi:rRNA methyltransferase [Caulobacter sp. CCUG 60055]|uniref:RsmB/NOP family class I SAM-dependent RNA methyltransferase n=1 Tax=Caulobacter sp. CCUG 60055 TaxID=2100090 RepID=UPI0024189F5F|nr:RsmB/NOP family class I SAM-dependent RNA methyltransferase [Caulobacter sp. CCUG 60055]MCI3179790.1 rRNA methyltransferase [Caulobacter sp. CCUG 60055]